MGGLIITIVYRHTESVLCAYLTAGQLPEMAFNNCSIVPAKNTCYDIGTKAFEYIIWRFEHEHCSSYSEI